MAIPKRFDNKIPTTRGTVEVKTLKTSDKEIVLENLIDEFNTYKSYVIDENTLKAIMKNDGEGNLVSLDKSFIFSAKNIQNNIINKINLYVDSSTGYVTYKVSDESKEIRISDAVYNDNGTLKDVSGNLLLDITSIQNKINENSDSINNMNIKYVIDSSKNNLIEDFNNNVILNVTDILSKIENNTNNISNMNIKYVIDSSKNNLIEDLNGNTILNATYVNNYLSEIKKEISYNIKVTSDGLISTKFLDIDALSFEQNTDNPNQVDVSIDTTKLTISDLNVYITPSSNSDGDVYVSQYLNIIKDSSGNITGFSIKSVNLDGTPPKEYEFNLLLKY